MRSTVGARVRSFPIFSSLICCFLLAGGLASAAEQVVSLVPGWNAVYLEVQPEPRSVEAVVGGLAIERVVMWLGSERKIQFISNPEEILPEDPEWLSWAPSTGLPAGGGTLHALLANRAYLVKLGGEAPVDWVVQGTAAYAPVRWRADDYTLTGLPVDGSAAPSLRDYFATSAGHVPEQVYRLSPAGAWEVAGEGEAGTLRRGEAYWVYTAGETSFQGPVGLRAEQGGGLDFGAGLPETYLTLSNATAEEQSCLLTPTLTAGGLLRWDASLNEEQGGWRAVVAGDAVTVPAGGETRVRLAISRVGTAADRANGTDGTDGTEGASEEIAGVLSVSSGAGTKYVLSVSARALSTDRKGLWVGDVVLDKVSTNIRKQVPTDPVPTDAPFQFRLIMHVNDSNEVTLLRQVVQAASGAAPGLYTDPVKIRDLLSGAGNPVARRVSTAVLGKDVEAKTGTVPAVWSGAGNCPAGMDIPLTFEYELGYDDPLNPFKHRFHIDHDNLQSDFTTNQGEGIESYTVTRDIGLLFACEDPQGAAESQWGDTVLGGTYTEKIYGILPKDPPSDAQEGDPDPTEFGSLQVTLNPTDGKWTVDALTPTADTPQYESGDTVHGLSVGKHIVHFSPKADFKIPAPLEVDVVAYADPNNPTTVSTTRTKTYVSGSGAEVSASGDNAIEVAGTFRLRRVSTIAALNP